MFVFTIVFFFFVYLLKGYAAIQSDGTMNENERGSRFYFISISTLSCFDFPLLFSFAKKPYIFLSNKLLYLIFSFYSLLAVNSFEISFYNVAELFIIFIAPASRRRFFDATLTLSFCKHLRLLHYFFFYFFLYIYNVQCCLSCPRFFGVAGTSSTIPIL